MIKKIYIDTSVFGGYFDTEFSEETIPFFEKLISDNIEIIVSDVLELEIYRAPILLLTFMKQWRIQIRLNLQMKLEI